ncbi:MAG: ABC transporter permease subunit [Gammaproteobacteria bacterium]|nr:ABC transporter permease subunit [Gammaproteobacteria bacterium]
MNNWFKTMMVHGGLWVSIAFLGLPLYLAVVAATYDAQTLLQGTLPYVPGPAFLQNMAQVWGGDVSVLGGVSLLQVLWNSFWMAFVVAFGKVMFAVTAAFSLVYFSFPFKRFFVVLIMMTLMLPIEVRLIPAFEIVALFHGLNSLWGLTAPLIVSASAILLFKQFFLKLSPELVDAAKLDGAGPIRFFIHILLPISKLPMSSLFVVMFIYGWNQYLWPLVITTNPQAATVVMGMRYLSGAVDLVPQWNLVMSIVLIALCPPCLVLLSMQRVFEKGMH